MLSGAFSALYRENKAMARVKYLSKKSLNLSGKYPNFHVSGSIKGMKKLYYGKNALLVRQGSYIYNVTAKPEIYTMAH